MSENAEINGLKEENEKLRALLHRAADVFHDFHVEKELVEKIDACLWHYADYDGRQEGPRGHDAPTCAGKWLRDGVVWDVVKCEYSNQLMTSYWGKIVSLAPGRYFGPIPDDKVNP